MALPMVHLNLPIGVSGLHHPGGNHAIVKKRYAPCMNAHVTVKCHDATTVWRTVRTLNLLQHNSRQITHGPTLSINDVHALQ